MLCQVAGERSCGASRPGRSRRGPPRLRPVRAARCPMRSAPTRRPLGAQNVTAPAELSTGCTECCGNVDYSTFANCGIFVSRDPCDMSEEAIHFLLRRARRGSRTKQHREAVRGGPQGPKRKVSRGCGRNRDRLGEFFWAALCCGARIPARLRSPRCRFRTRRVRRASTRA